MQLVLVLLTCWFSFWTVDGIYFEQNLQSLRPSVELQQVCLSESMAAAKVNTHRPVQFLFTSCRSSLQLTCTSRAVPLVCQFESEFCSEADGTHAACKRGVLICICQSLVTYTAGSAYLIIEQVSTSGHHSNRRRASKHEVLISYTFKITTTASTTNAARLPVSTLCLDSDSSSMSYEPLEPQQRNVDMRVNLQQLQSIQPWPRKRDSTRVVKCWL